MKLTWAASLVPHDIRPGQAARVSLSPSFGGGISLQEASPHALVVISVSS
jgi:hypothetical protein